MRPLTLASMAALNFGRTVPTTSSVAARVLALDGLGADSGGRQFRLT